MRRSRGNSSFLIKASPNSTFDILLRKAEQEGRIGGKHKCAICGMAHQSSSEAASCCEKLKEKS